MIVDNLMMMIEKAGLQNEFKFQAKDGKLTYLPTKSRIHLKTAQSEK